MEHYSAVGVSVVSALLYHVSYRGFICLMIDDAISAGAVHFVCGAWGLIAAGFTGMETARAEAGYPPQSSCSRGSQFLANLLMTVIIAVYVRLGRRRMEQHHRLGVGVASVAGTPKLPKRRSIINPTFRPRVS